MARGETLAGKNCSVLGQERKTSAGLFRCSTVAKKRTWKLVKPAAANAGTSKNTQESTSSLPPCLTQTIIALSESRRQIYVNQATSEAAWNNFLKARELADQNRYVNPTTATTHAVSAQRWYETALADLARADSLRKSFNDLNALCSDSGISLPERITLYDPKFDSNKWKQNANFVDPEILVSFSSAGTALACKKPWVSLWQDERIYVGYSLHSTLPNRADIAGILESKMGNASGYSMQESVNYKGAYGILEQTGQRFFESGEKMCSGTIFAPDIPKMLESELKRDAVAIGVWLIIESPKPSNTKLDTQWWGKLLSLTKISETPFPNKPTVFEAKVGAPAPGGGFVAYVADSPQPWGRFIEVANLGTIPCEDASSKISVALSTSAQGIPCKDDNGRKYEAIYTNLAQNLADCTSRMKKYDGIGQALAATKQLAEGCPVVSGKKGLAKVVSDLSQGGFDDWLLPTAEEVKLILGASKDLQRCLAVVLEDTGIYERSLITSTVYDENYADGNLALLKVLPQSGVCRTGSVKMTFSSGLKIGGGAIIIRYYS